MPQWSKFLDEELKDKEQVEPPEAWKSFLDLPAQQVAKIPEQKPQLMQAGDEPQWKTEFVGGLYGVPGVPLTYKKEEPTPGTPAGEPSVIGPTFRGLVGSVQALDQMIADGYDAWKNGKLPEMMDIVSGGALTSTPEHLKAAGDLIAQRGHEAAAAVELVKAVPFFGPILTAIDETAKEHGFWQAFGFGVGTAAIFKGAGVVHGAISDAMKGRVAAKASPEIRTIIEDASKKADEANQIPNEELKQARLEIIKTEARQNALEAIKNATTDEVSKEKTSAAAKEVRRIKGEPEWPPVSEKARARAEARIAAATPTKEELIREFKSTPPGEVPPKVTAPPVKTTEEVQAEIARQRPTIMPDLGEAGKAISANFYEGIFNSLRQGKDTLAGVKDPFIVQAKPYYDKGLITSPQDLADLANKRGKFAEEVGEGAAREAVWDKVAKGLKEEVRPKIKQTRQEKIAAERERLDRETEQWLKEHPKKEKIKPEEAVAKLEKAVTEKPAEPELKAPSPDEELAGNLIINKEQLDTLDREGIDIDELSNTQIENLFKQKGWEIKKEARDLKGVVEEALTNEEASQIDSIFRTDPETTKAQQKLYATNGSVASSLDELLSSNVANPKDPGTTAWKLSNDVNRWLDGEEIDIESTRNFLTKLSASADKFKSWLIDREGFDEAGFKDWSETISEIADWARKVDRPKIGQTEPTGGMSLYSGVDPTEVVKGIRKWYSSLRKVAEDKLPNVAPAEQIKNTLRKQVTKDEWEHSGLEEMLKPGQRFRKEEVLEQIDKTVPEFKDVILSDTREEATISTRGANQHWVQVGDGREIGPFGTWDEARGEVARLRSETKFSSYVEPGGTNYKELFVTAPAKEMTHAEWVAGGMKGEWSSKGRGGINLWQDGHSDYSDIENPIVRIRMNDRTGPNGEKILFGEEFQPPKKDTGDFQKMPKELQARWREIGMKRFIKYAIDNGYDKVAWTTGEMQLKRYNKTFTHVATLNYWQNPDGTYGVSMPENMGFEAIALTPDQLRANVGVDVTNKIINNSGKFKYNAAGMDIYELSGLDITVGESGGLAKLYDQDLGNIAKKLGGKVESIEIDTGIKDKFFVDYIRDLDRYIVANSYNGEWIPDLEFATRIEAEDAARSLNNSLKANPKSVPSVSLSPFKQGWTPTFYSGLPLDQAKKLLKDIVTEVRGRKEKIKRVSNDQSEILKNIMVLYNKERPIEADFTYSKGVIWKGLPEPTKKFDLNPQTKDTAKMDVANMNLEDDSISSSMYDPPFLVTPYESQKAAQTVQRFGSYNSVTELIQFNRKALSEIFRVTKPGGIAVVKIQDVNAAAGRGNRTFLASSELYNIATRDVGFVPIQRFIYDNPRALERTPGFGAGSYQPRITDSDFWVFKKPGRGKYVPAEERGAKLYSGVPIDERFRRILSIQRKPKAPLDVSKMTPEEKFTYEEGKAWNDSFEKSREAKRFNLQRFLDKAKLHTYRAIHERRGILRKQLRKEYGEDGEKVIQFIDAGDAADGTADRMYYEMHKEAFRDIPNSMLSSVDAVDLKNRLNDIYGYKTESEFRPPKGMDPSKTAAFDALVTLYRNLTPEERAKAEKASKIMSDHVKLWVDDLVRVGLKTTEEGEILKSHDYRKLKALDVEHMYDERYKKGVKLGDKLVRQTDSGVDPLGKNSIQWIETDSRVLYKETADRIYRRVKNQETKLAWKEFDEAHPENPFVIFPDTDKAGMITKIPDGWVKSEVTRPNGKVQTIYSDPERPWKIIKDTDKGYRRTIPADWIRDYWYDNGQNKVYYMHPDVALQVMSNGPHMSFELTRVLTNLLGVNLTRALAVGTSAAWATFRGITMDLGHTFFTAKYFDKFGKPQREYSKLAPVYLGQIGRDMMNTFHDVITRGKKTGLYQKNGGSMPFLAMREQHFLGRGVKPPGNYAKLMDALSYWGQSMEMWNRVAVMERDLRRQAKKAGITLEEAYKNKDMVRSAVNTAVERLPYRQGGWLVKEIDKIFGPFISASYNAARVFMAGAKENPVDFIARIGNIAVPTVGATIAAIMYAPEAKRDTPEWQYSSGAVFPLFPDSLNFIDENGDKRYVNVRLPLDPNIAFFYNIFRGMTEKMMYELGKTDVEPNYQALTDSLVRALPTGTPLSAAGNAYLAYFHNYDTWRGQNIVDETFNFPKSGQEGQFDPRVGQLTKDIGKTTGLSGPRLAAAARNFGLQSNEFTWAMGKLYDMANSDIDPEIKKQHWAISLSQTPGIRNVMSVTIPRWYETGKRAELKADEQFEKFLIREPLNAMAEGYYWKGVGSEAEIEQYIDKFEDKNVRDSLEQARRFVEKTKDLPHRKSWVSVFHTSPEFKAKDFYNIWKVESTPNERYRLDLELDALMEAGYVSGESRDRFFATLEDLQYGK